MEVSELIKLDSRKVRSNSNLMAIYINAFEKQFGRKPVCAGCTFANDFAKLVSAVNKGTQPTITTQKSKKMEKTFKLRKIQSKILAYRKDGKTFRVYDNLMKEDFAIAFLTHGTDEELAERKKLFAVLPYSLVPSKETEAPEEKQEATTTEEPAEAENAEEINQPIVIEEPVGKINVKVRKPRKNKK